MNAWEKFKTWLKEKGIDLGDKEKDVQSEFEKHLKETGVIDFSKIDLSKLSEKDINPLVKELLNETSVLRQQVTDLLKTLGDEKQTRENATKAATEQAKKDFEKKVNDRIKKALDEDKVITKAEEEVWKQRLTKDYDEWDKELSAKSVPKEFQGKKTEQNSDKTQPATTGNKTLDAVLQHSQAAAIEKPFMYDSLTK